MTLTRAEFRRAILPLTAHPDAILALADHLVGAPDPEAAQAEERRARARDEVIEAAGRRAMAEPAPVVGDTGYLPAYTNGSGTAGNT